MDDNLLSRLTSVELGELLAAVSDDIERGHIVKRIKLMIASKEQEEEMGDCASPVKKAAAPPSSRFPNVNAVYNTVATAARKAAAVVSGGSSSTSTTMASTGSGDATMSVTAAAAAPRRTGYVFSREMTGHHILDTVEGEHRDHPEDPNRIVRIFESIQERGLLDQLTEIPCRPATLEEVESCHTKPHRQYVDTLGGKDEGELREEASKLLSVYLNEKTADCAKLAAGSLVSITEAVMEGTVQNGVAIIRPPGHHAEAHCAMGFCIFNNVAIAAKMAQQKYGANKVLIVDWDIHHGNGTQNMFDDDPSVLYFSVHMYMKGKFFPSKKEPAGPRHVGVHAGEGFTVNVGWDERGMGDAEYIHCWNQVLLPIAYAFDPDLVIVSAGFDAARGDPLGGCDVTPEGYAHLTHLLSGLAGGKMIIALEGGYNLTSISNSMTACVEALVSNTPPRLEAPLQEPKLECRQAIQETIDAHLEYWPLLTKVVVPEPEVTRRNTRGMIAAASLIDTGGGGDSDSPRKPKKVDLRAAMAEGRKKRGGRGGKKEKSPLASVN